MGGATVCLSQETKQTFGERYRAAALSCDPSINTTIVDAWLLANAGNVEGALRQLRDIDSSVCAQSFQYFIDLCHYGRERALQWFDSSREQLGRIFHGAWLEECSLYAC